MKRKTVTGIALAALTMGGVALVALTAGGVVLGALTAALIASSSPADAGGWGHKGYGGYGYGGQRYGGRGYYRRGYGGRGFYGHGGGFRLRLVLPLYYGSQAYYGYRRSDPYPSYAAPAPVYAPPPAAAPAAAAQPYCREYTGSVTVNGQQISSYGTACLQQDGTWKIVD